MTHGLSFVLPCCTRKAGATLTLCDRRWVHPFLAVTDRQDACSAAARVVLTSISSSISIVLGISSSPFKNCPFSVFSLMQVSDKKKWQKRKARGWGLTEPSTGKICKTKCNCIASMARLFCFEKVSCKIMPNVDIRCCKSSGHQWMQLQNLQK